ncbi:hypothetical protein VP01_318g4 [Puccinia sorghi]|uniref:Uncharacterized protein n=1 Tax=Puccinia sorghi TaxID=27349 RepID=A0A0L6UYH8_9BASI|nr:hypothetical protein VP01_318g4 [Puccinia sorghi]
MLRTLILGIVPIPSCSTVSSNLHSEISQIVNAALQTQAAQHQAETAHYQASLAELTCELKQLKALVKPSAENQASQHGGVKVRSKSSKSNDQPFTSAGKKPRVSGSKKSAQVEAPAVTPSPKQHPQQMVTGDFPASFNTTKVIRQQKTLFIHLKILWGLLCQDSVPKAPDIQNLEEFYRNFTSQQQIDGAVAGCSPPLINTTKIQLLKDACAGLRVWCPNLEEDASSLYNVACCIGAITTFQEIAATQAYAYLNINPLQVNNTILLIQAYNHFVHFLMVRNYKKESKEAGTVARDATNKQIQKNRKRLRDAHIEHCLTDQRVPISFLTSSNSGCLMHLNRNLEIQGAGCANFQKHQRYQPSKPLQNSFQSIITNRSGSMPWSRLSSALFLISSLWPSSLMPPRVFVPPSPRTFRVEDPNTHDDSSDSKSEKTGEEDKEEGIDLEGPSPDASEHKFYEEGDAPDQDHDFVVGDSKEDYAEWDGEDEEFPSGDDESMNDIAEEDEDGNPDCMYKSGIKGM